LRNLIDAADATSLATACQRFFSGSGVFYFETLGGRSGVMSINIGLYGSEFFPQDLVLLSMIHDNVTNRCDETVNFFARATMDKRELTTILQDPASATRRLLNVWSDIPILLMLDIDWDRGPLVLVGLSDRMMWPLLPPGSLLQLNPKVRTIADGQWSEFERPIYLIEVKGKFHCCHAQRRGETLRLISHAESPAPPAISVPFKEARVRGQLVPIFRPFATRGRFAGRSDRRAG
jgi:hypothetical protein